ncbi:hypothetical protein CDAR_615501 [Caerostris darwini]|uniref:Uncharacterized protein n=1 Tax=Caerostris darwini TaxID=1538125 RepID=A0AAV4RXS6_9ARAC|nr:hypothetical protein CDAR_615501 [Caerostris darwini]
MCAINQYTGKPSVEFQKKDEKGKVVQTYLLGMINIAVVSMDKAIEKKCKCTRMVVLMFSNAELFDVRLFATETAAAEILPLSIWTKHENSLKLNRSAF